MMKTKQNNIKQKLGSRYYLVKKIGTILFVIEEQPVALQLYIMVSFGVVHFANKSEGLKMKKELIILHL